MADSGKDLDSRIERAVRRNLEGDPDLGSYHIVVKSRNGRVHLTGVVDVLAEKQRAEKLVRSMPGVADVENGLVVSTDGAINDGDVAFEVAEELEAEPEIDTANVWASTKGGVVELKGEVDSAGEARLAGEAASRARGVRDVINRLAIREKRKRKGR